MASTKRALYGLPIMRLYRQFRTTQLSKKHQIHPEGFRFAGSDIFFSPDWERSEVAVVKQQLNNADVFIDIGANQGFYTCLAAHRGLPVISIEPEEGNLRFLSSNIKENQFRNVELFPVAISNAPGILSLFGDGDMASAVPGWQSVSSTFVQNVASNTLDNLFGHRWSDKHIFIKVDIEGLEYELLQGADQLIARRIPPCWLIECFPWRADRAKSENENFIKLFNLMREHGYICRIAHEGNKVNIESESEIRKSIQSETSFNFLFLSREADSSRS